MNYAKHFAVEILEAGFTLANFTTIGKRWGYILPSHINHEHILNHALSGRGFIQASDEHLVIHARVGNKSENAGYHVHICKEDIAKITPYNLLAGHHVTEYCGSIRDGYQVFISYWSNHQKEVQRSSADLLSAILSA